MASLLFLVGKSSRIDLDVLGCTGVGGAVRVCFMAVPVGPVCCHRSNSNFVFESRCFCYLLRFGKGRGFKEVCLQGSAAACCLDSAVLSQPRPARSTGGFASAAVPPKRRGFRWQSRPGRSCGVSWGLPALPPSVRAVPVFCREGLRTVTETSPL